MSPQLDYDIKKYKQQIKNKWGYTLNFCTGKKTTIRKSNLWNGKKYSLIKSGKELIFKIYNKLIKSNRKKKPIFLNRENWLDLFPKKPYRWPTGTWNVTNVTSQRNSNHNYNEISPHTCWMASMKRISKCCLGVWKKGTPCALLMVM